MLIRRVPGVVGRRQARAFDGAGTQYLEAATGFGLGANDPFYFLVRARRDASTSNQCLVQLGRTGGSTNDSRGLLTVGASTVSARSLTATGTNGTASSAASAFTSGAGWYSLIAEFGGSASRRIIVNGVAVSNSTSRALTNAPNVLRVGVDLAGTTPFTGGLSQLAIFAGTATDGAIAQLAQGAHPLDICPDELLEFWELDAVGPLQGHHGTWLVPVNGGALVPTPPQTQGSPRLYRLPIGDILGTTGTTYSEAISLTGATAHTLATTARLQGSVAMTAASSVADSATAAQQAALTLSAIAALGVVDGGASVYAESIGLSAATGHTVTALLRATGASPLTAATGLTPTVIASLAASLALTGGTALTPASTLIAQATALVTAAAALSTSGGGAQTYTESVGLATQAALLTQTVGTLTGPMTLTGAATLTPTAAVRAGAAVALQLQAALAVAAAQMHATAVALSGSTGITPGTTAQYQAALSLSVAAVLQAAGTVAGVPVYSVLRVAAETLTAAAITGETLVQTSITDATFGAASVADEDLS